MNKKRSGEPSAPLETGEDAAFAGCNPPVLLYSLLSSVNMRFDLISIPVQPEVCFYLSILFSDSRINRKTF